MPDTILNIPILSQHQFRAMLLDRLVQDHNGYNAREIFDSLLVYGFAKLDFENLSKCLPSLFVFLPTVAVDFGDSQCVWIVSGANAILVHKKSISAPPTTKEA